MPGLTLTITAEQVATLKKQQHQRPPLKTVVKAVPKASSKQTTPPRSNGKWITIPENEHEDLLTQLASKCHSVDTLSRAGYPVGESSLPDNNNNDSDNSNVNGKDKRRIVALDCEMVGVGDRGRETEVVQICAVDVLTGEILVDKFVLPSKRVTQWRTRTSGMTPEKLRGLRKNGQTVKGASGARAALFRHIDKDTILVGQALHNDLKPLRIVHGKIIDTALLTKDVVVEEVGWCTRTWGLKTLCKDLVKIAFRGLEAEGHDCLEDAFGAREVLIWCLRNEGKLRDWARERGGDMQEPSEKAKDTGAHGPAMDVNDFL